MRNICGALACVCFTGTRSSGYFRQRGARLMGRNAREHRSPPCTRARARDRRERCQLRVLRVGSCFAGGFKGFVRARLWLACRMTRVAAGAERANSRARTLRLRESVAPNTPRVRARCAHVAETTTSLVIGTFRRRRCRPATGTESPQKLRPGWSSSYDM